MIVDTSIILEIQFQDKHAEWAAEQLDLHACELIMSTVNLAEALMVIQERFPDSYETVKDQLLNNGIKYVSPTVIHAQIVALARNLYPFNMGDCFAYALAKTEGQPILTLDSDFRNIDHPVIMPKR